MARKQLNSEEITNYRKMIIQATKDLVDKEGYKNITTRKIAANAHLNNAYLYKFFSNLNEILLYCSVIDLRNYYQDLVDNKVLTNSNYLEQYYDIWKIFLKHSLSHRESFKFVYFSQFSADLPRIIKDFFSLFPELFQEMPDTTKNLLLDPNINTSTNNALRCAFSNKHPEKTLQLIIDLTLLYFKKLLYATDAEDTETVQTQSNTMMYVLEFLNAQL